MKNSRPYGLPPLWIARRRIATLERELKTAEHGAIEVHEAVHYSPRNGSKEYIVALHMQIAVLRIAPSIGLVGASAPAELDAMELVGRESRFRQQTRPRH